MSIPAVRDRKAPTPLWRPGRASQASQGARSGSPSRPCARSRRSTGTRKSRSSCPSVSPRVGLPGVHFTPESPQAADPAVCRSDLLRIDGRPVWMKVSGRRRGGREAPGQGLKVSGCGPDAKGITLGAGTHSLEATWGKITGWNLDRLVLDSAPGGAALAPLADGMARPAPGTIGAPSSPRLAAPTVRVLGSSATTARLEVVGARRPFLAGPRPEPQRRLGSDRSGRAIPRRRRSSSTGTPTAGT